MMSIANILKAKGGAVASVTPDSRVADVLAELVTRRIGAVLVLDNNAVVGVVSERDVIRGLSGHGAAVLE
ncbi:MAG: CBS domain-containing protein, partial [Sandaracinobacteroides sp.]